MPDETPQNVGPRWAVRLLEWFVAPHLLEDLQGDLQEVFYKRVKQVGLARARREYAWAVLHYLTPSFYKRKQNDYPNPTPTDMLRNYVKIAFRNLIKHKGYSVINVVGLSAGLTCFTFIALWVNDELSYDTFNQNYERIVRLTTAEKTDNGIRESARSGAPLAKALQQSYSE